MKRLLALLVAASLAAPAFAGFTTFVSQPRPLPVFRTARPMFAPRPPVVVQKNVTVQQNVTHVQQSSGGNGFLSTFAGSFAGSGLANWLFAPKAAPVAPQPVPVDCSAEANKSLPVCQVRTAP